MKQLLLTISLFLLFTASSQAQTKCTGGDTLCLEIIPDQTINCASDTHYITANVTSSVPNAVISYKWSYWRKRHVLSTDSIFKFYAGFTNDQVREDDFFLDVSVIVNGKTFIICDTFKMVIQPGVNKVKDIGTFCASDSQIALSSLINGVPGGGTWECDNCNGIDPFTADKKRLKLNEESWYLSIRYIYNDNNCNKANVYRMSINDTPNVVVEASKYLACKGDVPIQLSSSEPGGKWSGIGIGTGERFFPTIVEANKSYQITYKLEHYTGCTIVDTLNIYVQALPTLNLSVEAKDTVNINSFFAMSANHTSSSGITWFTNGYGVFTPNDTADSIMYFSHPKDTGYYNLGVRTNFAGCPVKEKFVTVYGFNPDKTSIPKIDASIISIYPNPANNVLYLDKEDNSNYNIDLISADGKLVSNYNWANTHNFIMDISQITTGIYYIVLTDGNGNMFYKKLVIK